MILAFLFSLAGRVAVAAEFAVQWGHFGGSIQNSHGITGCVGQVLQGSSKISDGGNWQVGFLVPRQLINHAPVLVRPLQDQQVPSGFIEMKRVLSGSFFDEDAEPLVYRIECSPALRCSLSGDTISVSAAVNGSGVSQVVILASDPDGAAVIDSFDITQKQTLLPDGWKSLKTYGDPDFDFSTVDYSGWWIETRDSSISRVDSGRLKWQRPGVVEIMMSAPGADTIRSAVVIQSRALVVESVDKTKNQGGVDPELDYIVSGLVGSDSMSGRLIRDPGETVGTYVIRQGSLTAGPKYNLDFSGGVFTIRATSGVVRRLAIKPERVELRAVVVKAIGYIDPRFRSGIIGTQVPECDDGVGCVSIELHTNTSVFISASIFDHQGTYVIGWNGLVSSEQWRGLSVTTDGARRVPLRWNLHTLDGHPVAPGIYLWKVELKTMDGKVLKSVLTTGGK